MNDKEQKLYNRIKMVISTTAIEHDLTYGDIENALLRAYEEEHSEFDELVKSVKPKKEKEAVIQIGTSKKDESEVEKSRRRAREYYHKHKAEILEQRKASRENENGNGRRTRTKFNPDVIKAMTEHQDEMPIQLSNRIRQELGIEVSPSAISNWRYNHNKKPKVKNKIETETEEEPKSSVEGFFK